MEPQGLCPLEKWKSLEKDIREHTGLIAAAFNAEGVRIIPPKEWPNRLCPEIKANSKGQRFICATAHMNIASLAKTRRAPVIEACDAGRFKLVVPILAGSAFAGCLSACGLLLDDGEVDTFLVNKITGKEEAFLGRLATGIPTITMEKAQTVSRFIQGQVEKIVEH